MVPDGLAPVAGAKVQILPSGPTTTTGANGTFKFENLGPAGVTTIVNVLVTAPGTGSWEMNAVPLYPKSPTDPTAGNSASVLTVILRAAPQVQTYSPPSPTRPSNYHSPGSATPDTYGGGPCYPVYSSNTTTPNTIRVYDPPSDTVTTYDFKFYIQHVLPSEWYSNWDFNALEAGAMATKEYGWYWVNQGSKNGPAPNGQCYDVDDTNSYQIFNPSLSTTATTQAIAATWDWLYRQNGAVFEMSFQATLTGNSGEGCGAGANGSVMSQYGSQACANAGYYWQQILNVYYSGASLYANYVGISGGPDNYYGEYVVQANGGVTPKGSYVYNFGDPSGSNLNAEVVGIGTAPYIYPAYYGYDLVAADGGVFSYGNDAFYGSMGGKALNAPMVGIAVTNDGGGYWLVGADGGIFTFGDAGFYGSEGGQKLNAPIVGMYPTPDDGGYWLVGADGGIFTFGDAGFYGSEGGQKLNAPIVGMVSNRDGTGYWLLGRDGGIFTFNVPFNGSFVGDSSDGWAGLMQYYYDCANLAMTNQGNLSGVGC